MTRTITGMFDSREAAQAVIDHLVAHDHVRAGDITLHGAPAGATAGTTGDLAPREEEGFWASLKSLFVPEEDRHAYGEGLRRGGYLLSAELPEDKVAHVTEVFEEYGAVDLDAREAEWRDDGWTSYDATAASEMATPAAPAMVPAVPLSGSTATGSMATGSTAGAFDAARGEEGGVIPVVEETLRVGKRDVEHGRVRVRSYVTETPVTEQVSLREERVDVQRRAVDRPLTDADMAFRDRTIEAVEHREEAVVSKEARIVEEVVISKDSNQRTDTIAETVRRQDVEVEDTRTGTAPRKPV